MICELLRLRRTYSAASTDTTWHSHHTLQIGYVLGGEVMLHLSGKVLVIRRGDFYLITRHHLHRIETSAGLREWHGFAALTGSSSFFTSAAMSSMDWGWLDGRSLVIRAVPRLEQWFVEIDKLQAVHHGVGNLFCQGLFVSMLAMLNTMRPMVLLRDAEDAVPVASRSLFQVAVQCIERMYENETINVEDLAGACSVSRSTLDKLFHAQLGYGPKQFLQRYRVDRAKELISAGEHSMGEVARRAGFGDAYTFSRVFRRLTGMAPTAYRAIASV